MTSQPQPPYDPPRRPLRVRVEVLDQLDDGSSIMATAWRTLEPNEPGYEQAYIMAAGRYRLYGDPMPYAAAGGVGRGVGMTDTAHDELVALTAEAEAMSQRLEDEERAWQAQPSAGNVPDAESRGAESDQRTQLDLLQETIVSSRTLLDQAEQALYASPTDQHADGEAGE